MKWTEEKVKVAKAAEEASIKVEKRSTKEVILDLQAQLRVLPIVLGEIGVLTVELLDTQGLLNDNLE